MTPAHYIMVLAIAAYTSIAYSLADVEPIQVTQACPKPYNSAMVRDCQFQTDGVCRFVSIYEYQDNVIREVSKP